MSDFVTMQCPNCGGKLTIKSNVLSLKCEHCGVEHMIRREAGAVTLESYARCPVCNRNDKAEKVTAILRSQTHNAHGIAYHTVTTHVNTGFGTTPVSQQVAVPVQTSQMSELARYLAPPAKPDDRGPVNGEPKLTHKSLYGAILFGVVGFGFLLITLVALAYFLGGESGTTRTPAAYAILMGLLLISLSLLGLSIFLIAFALTKERHKNREIRNSFDVNVRQIKQENEDSLKKWSTAMDRWNQLYYCGRDDCVFVPGTQSYAPVQKMTDYLYQN